MAKAKRSTVIIAGGGTAGHVLPGLAIAQALVDEGIVADASEVHLLGSERGTEVRLAPEAGFSLSALPGRGIQRRLALANIAAVWGLFRAMAMGIKIVANRRPGVVVSLGGYASVPGSLAAVLLRVPLVVVEQNAVPGAANRVFGRFASACVVAFDHTGLPKATNLGNPVREEVRRLANGTGRSAARADLQLDTQHLVVVFGGSLGARRINQATAQMVEEWAGAAIVVHHVLGGRDFAQSDCQPRQAPSNVDYRPVEYENNLPKLLAAADVVICRSGATTVAELSTIGVPAILIPLPGAPGDHQTLNAQELQTCGAAVLLPDADTTGRQLAETLGELLENNARRATMAQAGAALGRPYAAQEVAALVKEKMRD